MNLEYVPLLRVQCELQGLPRNYARFQQYLRTTTLGFTPRGLSPWAGLALALHDAQQSGAWR